MSHIAAWSGKLWNYLVYTRTVKDMEIFWSHIVALSGKLRKDAKDTSRVTYREIFVCHIVALSGKLNNNTIKDSDKKDLKNFHHSASAWKVSESRTLSEWENEFQTGHKINKVRMRKTQ